jgi:VWFA-related protein
MRLRRARSFIPAIAAALLAAFAAHLPNPVHAEDRTTPLSRPQNSSSIPTTTLQVYSREIILDVVVTDSNGNFVHGLKQSDFTVFEDKKQMAPNSFEEHRSDESPSTAPTPVKETLPPNTFTNKTSVPDDRPINILLIDNLNTPGLTQMFVRDQMLAFVNRMQPNIRVAVFSLSTDLTITQGITTDPELIRAAINKKAFQGASPLEDYNQDLADADDIPQNMLPPPSPYHPTEINPDCEHIHYRAVTTLGAMNRIARYLSGMPGRKNLIWFTGSAPIDNSCGIDSEALQTETDLLTRSHVTIFPIDGRLGNNTHGPGHAGAEHGTMNVLATQTGGKATYGSADVTGAIERAIDSGSNFYTLTYAPTNLKLDTDYRVISVKMARPGLHLVYRPGYYASTPGKSLSGEKITHATPMQAAMERGGLEPTQILFKVKASPAPATEVALPIGNLPDPKKMKPPYRHYSISYSIAIDNIAFAPSPDGNYRADFELGIMAYDSDGKLVNTVSKQVRPVVPPAVYQSMLRSGAAAHQEIDIPAKGEFFLRVGVHDLTTDHVGALEVPTSSIAPEAPPTVASQK